MYITNITLSPVKAAIWRKSPQKNKTLAQLNVCAKRAIF